MGLSRTPTPGAGPASAAADADPDANSASFASPDTSFADEPSHLLHGFTGNSTIWADSRTRDSGLGSMASGMSASRLPQAGSRGRQGAPSGSATSAVASSTPAFRHSSAAPRGGGGALFGGAGGSLAFPVHSVGAASASVHQLQDSASEDVRITLDDHAASLSAVQVSIEDLQTRLHDTHELLVQQADSFTTSAASNEERLAALFNSVSANTAAVRNLQTQATKTVESMIALSKQVALAQQSADKAVAATAALQASRSALAIGSSVDARLPAAADARAPNLAKVFTDCLGAKQVPFSGFVMTKGSAPSVDWNTTHKNHKPFVIAVSGAYKEACTTAGVDAIPLGAIFSLLLPYFSGRALEFVTAWHESHSANDDLFTFPQFLADLQSLHRNPERIRNQAEGKLESLFKPTLCHGRAPQDWILEAEPLFSDAGYTDDRKLRFLRARIKDLPPGKFKTYAALRDAFFEDHSEAAEHALETAAATALADAHKALEAQSKPSSGKTAAASPRSWSSSSPKAATPAPSGNNSASETRKAASPAATADHAGRSPSQRPPHSKVGHIAAKAKATGNGSGSQSLETISSFSDDGMQYSDADEEE